MSDQITERIARALAAHDLAVVRSEGGPEFPEWERLTRQSPQDYLAQAQTVVESLGLIDAYTYAWDGDPSMSGQPHRQSLGGDHARSTIMNAIARMPRPELKPNLRVERRYITSWERVGERR